MPTSQEHIDQLQTLRKQFISRIEAIESDVHHKEEPVEKDFAEQVTQRENDDVLHAIDSEAHQTVMLIDAALARIKSGNYGICTVCCAEIPEKRLSAVPYATTCIDCAE